MKKFRVVVFTKSEPVTMLVSARSKGEAARTAVVHAELTMGLTSLGCEATKVGK